MCSLARPKWVALTPAVLLARPGSSAPPTVRKIERQEAGGGGGGGGGRRRERAGERGSEVPFDSRSYSNQQKIK